MKIYVVTVEGSVHNGFLTKEEAVHSAAKAVRYYNYEDAYIEMPEDDQAAIDAWNALSYEYVAVQEVDVEGLSSS